MDELLYILIGAILGIAAFLFIKDQIEAKRERDAERRKNAAIQNAMAAKANSRKPSFYEEDENGLALVEDEDRGTVWPKRHY